MRHGAVWFPPYCTWSGLVMNQRLPGLGSCQGRGVQPRGRRPAPPPPSRWERQRLGFHGHLAAHPCPSDGPSFICPEGPGVTRGAGSGGRGRRMCKWEIGLPAAVLFKAFGRDKLTQEGAPSQKAALTRHTHMQDCLWNPDMGGKGVTVPASSPQHPGIQPAQRRDPQSVS